MKFSLVIISAFLFSFSLIGQSPYSNFELLDHTDDQTILSSYVVNGDDIIYVVQDLKRGLVSTSVKLVRDGDNPVDLLDSPLKFRSESKVLFNADGSLRIMLFNLINSANDDFRSDFVEIIEQADGTYSTRRILNPDIFYFDRVTSMALDSTDNLYVIVEGQRLLKYSEDTLQNELQADNLYKSKLHKNSNGIVCLLSIIDSLIYTIDDIDLIEVNDLPHQIIESKVINGDNWLLTEDKEVLIYSKDFSTLLHQLDVPFDIESLDQVDDYNSEAYIMEHLDTGFRIYDYEIDSLIQVFEKEVEEFAFSNKLQVMNDSMFLTAGQYVIENITDNAFFRVYTAGQQFAPQRAYTQLDYFNINYLSDTLISGAPFDELYVYGVDFSLQNLSFTDVNLASIYTSNFQLGGPFYITYNQQIMEQVAPVQSFSEDTTMLVILQHPDDVRVTIPGSDYMFNIYGSPIDANVTTSTKELVQSQDIDVFPNPFHDIVTINSDEPLMSVAIYDVNGRLVEYHNSSDSSELDLSHLELGVYFLKAFSKSSIYTKKIINLGAE